MSMGTAGGGPWAVHWAGEQAADAAAAKVEDRPEIAPE